MKTELSILLPVHNNVCVGLVQQLLEQVATIRTLDYEIIVMEDGSTDAEFMKRNSSIATMSGCRYIVLEENIGRAAVRNRLAQEAHYEWLLLMDSDVQLQPFFLENYLKDREEDADVVCGGVRILSDERLLENNLRYKYEYDAQPKHLVQLRQAEPYKSFRSTNFLIRRQTLLALPFDERIKGYGYEDVLFGKMLCMKNIPLLHIDNPVILSDFENNNEYLKKVEEAMHTLYSFADELCGYSPLLDGVKKSKYKWAIRLWHALFGWIERDNLKGKSPSLTALKLYKLGYFLKIKN